MTRLRRWLLVLTASLLLNGLMFFQLAKWIENWNYSVPPSSIRVRILEADGSSSGLPRNSMDDVVVLPSSEVKPPEPEPEPEREDPKLPDGQIVEIAPPANQEVPAKSDYLAEYNSAVPKETRTEAYKVNPEVLANIYSRESKIAQESLPDVGATTISSGATVGTVQDLQNPGGAPHSAIPSPYALTNKAGFAAPTIGSNGDSTLAGAPQNDLLNEALGDSVALNARLMVGAEYLNRIRRQVNHYWVQNIENLPAGTVIAKESYRTVVEVVLTGEGRMESISVSGKSGSDPVDQCLKDAFRVASPFPNPPEQLISRDGRVYLPDFDFTVQFGQARMQYQGVDPRAGVQFPGILKSPR